MMRKISVGTIQMIENLVGADTIAYRLLIRFSADVYCGRRGFW